MPTQVVVWVDPGWEVGLARIFHDNGIIRKVHQKQVGGAKEPPIQWLIGEVLDYLDATLALGVPATVGVEDFNTSGQLSRPGKDTISIVGAVRGWAYARGIQPVVVAPAHRKSELHTAAEQGGRIHETDALAHCRAHIRENYPQ